ncbi:MAG: hypothetical protein MJY66_04460 [Bacteroidaceae bacterium]|nr:hypothetical protein [Bacteroidaceae bacterium]
MKRIILILLFTCFRVISYSQEVTNSQAVSDLLITGRLVDICFPYPTISDQEIKEMNISSDLIIYPTLIVNNIIITDTIAINLFRNNVRKENIARKRFLLEEQARKKGIPEVSKDGVLLIRLKRNFYWNPIWYQ